MSDPKEQEAEGGRGPRPKSWAALGTALTCLLFALMLQWANGAWHADLAGDPDEAAHAVTSLMVRDYLTDALPKNPLHYAQDYYEHFPKVALGHYPPGYYLITSLVLLPFPQVVTLIALQAVFCGILGWQIFQLGHRLTGPFGAWLAAVVFVALPMVQKVASCVMSDLLLAIWCLAAVQAWLAYLRRPGVWMALLFGFMAAAAILTKGAGLSLALVPPVSLLLAWEFRLLKKASFWLAPLPVIVLAAPWMVYSVRFTQEGMASDRGMAYVMKALPFYAKGIVQVFGPLIAVLVVVGLLRVLISLLGKRPAAPDVAVLWALIAGTLAVALVVPAGLSTRYLVPAGGAFLLLALAEVCYWIAFLQKKKSGMSTESGRGWGSAVGAVVAAGATIATVGWSAPKVASGFNEAVTQLELGAGDAASSSKHGAWIVSSDARGEGAVIAAAAFGLPSRKDWPLTVLRASKELSSSDWMGRGYETQFKSSEELLKRLDKLKVDRVIADESVPSTHVQAHHAKVVEALSNTPEWTLAKSVTVDRGLEQKGQIKLFRRIEANKTVASPEPKRDS
ncbi:hypothetical protein [Roseimicrobium sp. ORNL1]|uniref:ArnT family glycosyltransferase n=1 Tax=Roseimicrobium sp. ORNL1 TaxID=2711231 RepID=UPI0013E1C677|nr:hypothetical protein [Roseimicrobium sp. ORNL1]QIF03916.1 hypothetical protein G5S37_21085 [Roseimicrobium sp. ORNL1]